MPKLLFLSTSARVNPFPSSGLTCARGATPPRCSFEIHSGRGGVKPGGIRGRSTLCYNYNYHTSDPIARFQRSSFPSHGFTPLVQETPGETEAQWWESSMITRWAPSPYIPFTFSIHSTSMVWPVKMSRALHHSPAVPVIWSTGLPLDLPGLSRPGCAKYFFMGMLRS